MTMHVEVGHDIERPGVIGIIVREGDAMAQIVIPMPFFHMPAIKAFVKEINEAFAAIETKKADHTAKTGNKS